MDTFTGFPEAGIALLKRLSSMDKAEFEEHRDVYRPGLLEPAKAFVHDLGAAIRDRLGARVQAVAKTNGSISPINNDLRFNPDAARYKDHILFRFWEGGSRKTAPTLYVRLAMDGLGFAAGAAFADVATWREAVDRRGDELASALASVRGEVDANVVGESLKRVPAGFDPDHPHGDLLRHKFLQVRWPTPMPVAVHGPELVDHCIEELRRVIPVHRWLVETFS